MDIQQELERALGHGPTLPAPEERLAAGRAALRRRRVTVAAGTVVVFVAIAAPFAVSGSGATQGSDVPPAAPPPTSSAPEPAPDRTSRADPKPRFDASMGEVAYPDVRTGELMIHPDAIVLQRIDDLYPGKATESVALDLRLDGKRHWVALEWDEGGSMGTFGGPDDPFYASFDDFVAKATSGGGMTSGPPPRDQGSGDDLPVPGEVVGLTVDESGFVASGDTRIFEQDGAPDLPESVSPSGSRVLVAYVHMAGVRQFVLFRDPPDGDGEIIAVHSEGHGDSLTELLAWVRERYASGEGLL